LSHARLPPPPPCLKSLTFYTYVRPRRLGTRLFHDHRSRQVHLNRGYQNRYSTPPDVFPYTLIPRNP
jgi:hypothetical protein